jgi:hypothetical protein
MVALAKPEKERERKLSHASVPNVPAWQFHLNSQAQNFNPHERRDDTLTAEGERNGKQSQLCLPS